MIALLLAVPPPPPPPPAQFDDQVALVTLQINTMDKGEILVAIREKDTLVDAQALRDAGVKLKPIDGEVIRGHELVSLAALAPDVTGQLDIEGLALKLTARAEALATTVINLQPGAPKEMVYREDTSAFVNYSLRASTAVDVNSYYEAGVSIAGALVYSSASWPMSASPPVRGMSYAEINDRHLLHRWTIGDGFVATGPLGGGQFVGGVTLAKSYDIDPYFYRYNTLDANGAALTPSTVDVYVNDRLVRRENIQPGLFKLQGVPLTTGSGDVRYVVRDAFGRSQQISSTYYLAAQSLAPGVQDYAYGAGFRRQNMGTASFDYGAPVALARHRIGLTPWATGGLRLEAALDLVSAGADATFAAPVGQFDVAASASGNRGKLGAAGLVGWSYLTRRFGANLLLRKVSDQYATSSTTFDVDRAITELSGSVGIPLGNRVSISANTGLAELRDNGNQARLSAMLNTRVWRSVSLLVSSTGMLQSNGQRSAMLGGLPASLDVMATFVFGLPWQQTGTVGWRESNDNIEAVASLQKSLPYGPGLGYRVQASGNQRSQTVFATAEGQTSFGRASLDYTYLNGSHAGALTLAGGVATVRDGGVFLSRPIQNSFAVVRIPEVPDARIQLHNQEVGTTNSDGALLVPNLLAYQANRVSLVDTDIPLDRSLGVTEQLIAPPRRAGVLIDFIAQRTSYFKGTVVVDDRGSDIIPAYGELLISEGDKEWVSFIGKQGEFELENPQAGAHTAQVSWNDSQCRFTVTIPATEQLFNELGPLRCTGARLPRPESDSAPATSPDEMSAPATREDAVESAPASNSQPVDQAVKVPPASAPMPPDAMVGARSQPQSLAASTEPNDLGAVIASSMSAFERELRRILTAAGLAKPPTYTGRVVLFLGDAEVVLEDAALIFSSKGRRTVTLLDADGGFELINVAPGYYPATVWWQGGSCRTALDIPVYDGSAMQIGAAPCIEQGLTAMVDPAASALRAKSDQLFRGRIVVQQRDEEVAPPAGVLSVAIDEARIETLVDDYGSFALSGLEPGDYAGVLRTSLGTCRVKFTIPETDDKDVWLGTIKCEARGTR